MGPYIVSLKYYCPACHLTSEYTVVDQFHADMEPPDWKPSLPLPCNICKKFTMCEYPDDYKGLVGAITCMSCSSVVADRKHISELAALYQSSHMNFDERYARIAENLRADPLHQLLVDVWCLVTSQNTHIREIWNPGYKNDVRQKQLKERLFATEGGHGALIDDNELLMCPSCDNPGLHVICRIKSMLAC